MQGDPGKARGTDGRVIDDNHEVFHVRKNASRKPVLMAG
jgi:hypothetical protein